jgi:hypothetical protein
MAGRKEPHTSLDYFPTPGWGTRALVEHVLGTDGRDQQDVWDPACGGGHMVRPLGGYFRRVHASDVHQYGSNEMHDFLGMAPPPWAPAGHWIVTNPPFRLGPEFVLRALDEARHGVAMLVRTAFIESVDRYRKLFKPRPPTIVATFVERLAILKGRTCRAARSATSYSWLVWDLDRRAAPDPVLRWIPPSRRALERSEDWDCQGPKADGTCGLGLANCRGTRLLAE